MVDNKQYSPPYGQGILMERHKLLLLVVIALDIILFLALYMVLPHPNIQINGGLHILPGSARNWLQNRGL